MRYNKHMHFKRLILLLVGLMVVAAIAPLFILKPWRQPSQEMQLLQTVETRVNLPAPVSRQVDDRGQYLADKDGKHNSRRITRHYNDAQTVERIRIRLDQLGWQQHQSAIIGTAHSIMLVSITDRTCIQVQADNGSNSTDTNTVAFLAASDDACSGYFDSVL
jgi:hypothetical protein